MVEVLHELENLWSEVGSAQLLAQLLGLWFGQLEAEDVTPHQHDSLIVQQLSEHREHKVRRSRSSVTLEVFQVGEELSECELTILSFCA